MWHHNSWLMLMGSRGQCEWPEFSAHIHTCKLPFYNGKQLAQALDLRYKARTSGLYRSPGAQMCSLKLCTHTRVHQAASVQLSCCDTDNHCPSIFLFPFFPYSSKYLCKALYKSLSRYKSLKQFASNFRVVAQPCSALPYFWATAVLYLTERRRLKEGAKKKPLPHSDVLNIQEKCRYLKMQFNWE